MATNKVKPIINEVVIRLAYKHDIAGQHHLAEFECDCEGFAFDHLRGNYPGLVIDDYRMQYGNGPQMPVTFTGHLNLPIAAIDDIVRSVLQVVENG